MITSKGNQKRNKKQMAISNGDTIVIVSTFACIYSEPERRRGKENKPEREK